MKSYQLPSLKKILRNLIPGRYRNAVKMTSYIQPADWNACAARIDWNEMKGKSCYAGLDLSSTTDLTALVILFLPDSPGGKYRLKCHFWMPEDTIRRRANEDRVPYDVWVKQGWITATPGNVVDYAFIRKQISGYEDRAEGPGYFYEEAVGKIFQLEELAFDPWGAAKLAVELSNNTVCRSWSSGRDTSPCHRL